MSLEILCIDLRYFTAKAVAEVSKNWAHMVALEGAHMRKQAGGCAIQGVCVKSLASIGSTVPEIGIGPKV